MTQVTSIERTKFGFNVCASSTRFEVHPFIYTRANFHQACTFFEVDTLGDYSGLATDNLIKSLRPGDRLEAAHGRIFRILANGVRHYWHTDGNMYGVSGAKGHCLHIEINGPTCAKVDIRKLKNVYGSIDDGIELIKGAVITLDAYDEIANTFDARGLNYWMEHREQIENAWAPINEVRYECAYKVVDDFTGMTVYESDDKTDIDTYMQDLGKYFHMEANTKAIA